MSLFDFISYLGQQFILSVIHPFYKFVMSGDTRYFFVYLSVGLALSWVFRSKILGKKSFLETLTDKKVWSSKSALNDYSILFINSFLVLVVISVVASQFSVISQWTVDFFRMVGVTGVVSDSTAVMAGLALTITLFLVRDFLHFLTHYLFHIFPVLWEFHKVHHSAEVLNFTTSERSHPVEILSFSLVMAISTALVNGLFFSFFGDSLSVATVMGANIFVFLGNMIGGSLRHSPFALGYGKTIERWLISPAMHHIHHSEEERHFDKNMGGALAIWDRMFGTWLQSEPGYQYSYGMGAETKEYRSLSALYITPFVKAKALLMRGQDDMGQGSAKNLDNSGKETGGLSDMTVGLLYVVLIGGTVAVGFSLPDTLSKASAVVATPKISKPTAGLPKAIEKIVSSGLSGQKTPVFIEDLTFAELRHLIDHGSDSVIIPTGGTEQNGLHMVLGKHNYVVRYTAKHIAQKAGNILVAPVMAYVPEGNIERKEGHMAFAGTISLPEPVFESILESAASSLKQHGFRVIYFLGDSGGNQAAQRRVAGKLDRQWKSQGVRVVHLGGYYNANAQQQALLQSGETADTIGSHAGIRDSSELMFVRPGGVRTNILKQLGHMSRDFSVVGYTGRPEKASAELGKQMLSLKIRAALTQIRSVRGGL